MFLFNLCEIFHQYIINNYDCANYSSNSKNHNLIMNIDKQ